MSKYYNVGNIVNTQGLQGEVRIKSLSDFSEARFKKSSLLSLFDEKGEYVRELKVTRGRQQKNLWIVKFEGLDSINDVEKFKGFSLKIDESCLSDLAENEFYYHEIIGLEVFENDVKIGKISEILQPGANDVWLVKREGKKDLLLPYIESVVLSVSIEEQRVEVEIPEGLDE